MDAIKHVQEQEPSSTNEAIGTSKYTAVCFLRLGRVYRVKIGKTMLFTN